MSDEATDMLRWLVSMDNPDDAAGLEARRTVMLTKIVDRARAALAAHDAEVAEGTQPGCTGAGDCPAPAHLHGCYADIEGHCSDPDEHAEVARVLPSVKDVAEAVRGVQGVPFVGPKQRKIAAAVLALLAAAPSREQVEREAAVRALRQAADEIAAESEKQGGLYAGDCEELVRARADRLDAGGDRG